MSIYSNKNFRTHPKNQITKEEVLAKLSYDRNAGTLQWNMEGRHRWRGQQAGYLNPVAGYLVVKIGKYNYQLHRIIWLLETGSFPENLIDHINGDRSDNRFSNLRDATHSQNLQNVKYKSRGEYGMGVRYLPFCYRGDTKYARRKPYQATIRIPGRKSALSLGYYETQDEAETAYIKAKLELHTYCDATQYTALTDCTL